MGRFILPPTRAFNSEWKTRNVGDVVAIEAFPIQDGERLELTFEGGHAERPQGVWLSTDVHVVINAMEYPSASVWQDSAPQTVRIQCRTMNGALMLYNIWEREGKPESLAWSSGMLVEELERGRRYRCNDIGFETKFDKIVFRLERVE